MKSSFNFAVASLLLTSATLPALAQSEISNNQPVTRSLSQDEVRIMGKLKEDFRKGLIDSNQLAQMQRDFDGILVKEDDYKSRGLTDDGKKTIEKSLCAFEAKLDKSAGGVSTTAEAHSVVGPKADENNTSLDRIVPAK